MNEAADIGPDELRVGVSAEFSRDLTQADVDDFARNSGDRNPLHVDAAYAATTGFGKPIAHGAFQIGLASAIAGMYLPGRRCLLTTVQARFPAPLQLPTRVVVRGEITAWNRFSGSGQLRVVIVDERAALTTTEVTAGFALHEQRSRSEAAAPMAAARSGAGRPVVVVTGASGGLGRAIAESLVASFDVIAVINRTSLPESLAADARVEALALDFGAADWPGVLEAAIGTRSLYGIVHAAWPGMPHGGLLSAPVETIRRQMDFATTHTIALARVLQAKTGEEGGRLVALGSIAGQRKPALAVSTYSLSKAALEQTVKLLAPELARKKITINAVCPSFVPTGMNEQSDARARKLEAARVPLGRLCSPEDVVGTVRFLLSPEASFLSG
ncbi:MAG TPA: SDR family oxidoreductase, partial [Steroidobacteraceae bacterium]|nr:SDR family oxidoreductase [Steroidobacteraceae bacterium]